MPAFALWACFEFWLHMVCSHYRVQRQIKMGCLNCEELFIGHRDGHQTQIPIIFCVNLSFSVSVSVFVSVSVSGNVNTALSPRTLCNPDKILSFTPVQLCKATSYRTKKEFAQTVAHWFQYRGQHCTISCICDCIRRSFSFRTASPADPSKSFNSILLLNLRPNISMLTLFEP